MKLFLAVFLFAATLFGQSKTEKEVLAAAQDLCKAQMNKDRAALERLLADEIIYSHSSAMRETKADHIAATLKPTNKYTNIALNDPIVRVYGDTAVLFSKPVFSVDNDGKKADNPLSMLQAWVKKGGRWVLVARWTTRLP